MVYGRGELAAFLMFGILLWTAPSALPCLLTARPCPEPSGSAFSHSKSSPCEVLPMKSFLLSGLLGLCALVLVNLTAQYTGVLIPINRLSLSKNRAISSILIHMPAPPISTPSGIVRPRGRVPGGWRLRPVWHCDDQAGRGAGHSFGLHAATGRAHLGLGKAAARLAP